jgi:hypothetical protein
MGVKYTKGSPQDLIRGFERRKQEIPLRAAAIVTETVKEAQEIQRDFLNKATTSYGEYRFGRGRGGSAGRNDTGTMIDGIGWEVEKVSKNRIDGRWGWVKGVLDYFVYQEKGIGVPEARSLLDSYVVVREKFIARMKAEFD